MITARDLAYGLFGAWRLAHFDRSGMQYFEDTAEAYWKSFFAAIIVLPAFIVMELLTIAARPEAAQAAHPLRVIVVFAIFYIISWAAFPVVMIKLAEMLDRRERYIRFIVAANWSTIIQVAVALPALTLVTVGGSGATQLIYLAATLAILTYGWFITRTALDIPGVAAAGIVALDLTLSILIASIGDAVQVGLFSKLPA